MGCCGVFNIFYFVLLFGNAIHDLGIVSLDLEMAGDRFTLFRHSSFKEGVKVIRNG